MLRSACFLYLALFLTTAVAAQHPPKLVRLGILYWSMNIPGQVAMRTGIERELDRIRKDLAKREVELAIETVVRVAGDGKKGIERQIQQMNELVDLGVDYLIVQPTDNAALVKPLLRANKAGIPVLAYDQYISKGEIAVYLTSDNTMAGYLNGEYLASRFPNDHEIQLVLVEYPHVSSTVERVNGFLSALRDYKQAHRVIGTYEAVEPVGGKKAGLKILADHPRKGSIDAVFTVNDGGGLAVVDELAKAGRDEILSLSIDGDAKSVANVQKGRLTVIDCAQFCGALGRTTMEMAWRLIQDKEVPKQILLPVFPITKDTLHLFKGWNEAPTMRFEKPWKSKTPTWTWKLKERK